MKRYLFPAILLLLSLCPIATAQSQQSDLNANTPLWLKELSNLPTQSRQEYTYYFKKAKEAYAMARIGECLSYLNSCELIYNKNPNVWSLRASAFIAQRRFDEAKPVLAKVLAVQPDDSISLFNNSLISLGEGRYDDCRRETAELLSEIRHTEGLQLIHSLTFRLLLCYLMMEQEEKARDLVSELTALDDSPLYYYSQAAFAIYNKDVTEAKRNIMVADRIYAKEKYLLSYKQNLSFSNLEKKHLGTDETKTDAEK